MDAYHTHHSAAPLRLLGPEFGPTGPARLYSTMTPVRQTGAPAGPATGLATPLQYVKGVGPQRGKLLAKKDLTTVEDALFFIPIRHEDRTLLTPPAAIQPGRSV